MRFRDDSAFVRGNIIPALLKRSDDVRSVQDVLASLLIRRGGKGGDCEHKSNDRDGLDVHQSFPRKFCSIANLILLKL